MTEAEALEIAREAAVAFIETEHNRIISYDPKDKWTADAQHAGHKLIIEAGMLLALL